MALKDFKANTTRALVSVTIDNVIKYVNKDREKNLLKLTDIGEELMASRFGHEVFDGARKIISDPNGKWMKFTNSLIDELDPHVMKMQALNLGYQAGFYGFEKTRELGKKLGYNIPWIILLDPTSACNMHCTGCWAAEYGHKMSLSYEDLDSIVTQGEKLGIYFYPMTGGEPLMRKKDIIKLAKKHNKSAFHIFTNGTLVDEEFCRELRAVGNISLALSVEGFEEVNDARRGKGSFEKVMRAMDLLFENGILFGASVCYTSENYISVTSDEFLDMLISHGARLVWYFHYMPVGNGASTELLLSPRERAYMYRRVREIRSADCSKPIWAMDFQNDGEFVHGCIAGGRIYCHINPNGDVEPCVFIHYSGANIHDRTLLECLRQPLFLAYRAGQPFNENPLRPCPMLENPECLPKMIAATGAKSTDMQSPEDVCSLCGKCEKYAKDWAPVADALVDSYSPDKIEKRNRLPRK